MKIAKVLVFLMFVASANAQSIIDSSLRGPVNYTKEDIKNELAKYPAGLVQSLIDKIVITDAEGGLAIRCQKEIRLSANASLRHMKIYLHHEFSSFILYRGKCDDSEAVRKVNEIRNKFIALNDSFNYNTANEDQAWKKIDEGTDLGNHFYAYYYATCDFENDFNVIAQLLFTDGEKTTDFMIRNQDKPVGKKIQLVIDFYTSVDNRFSKAFFRAQKL